MEECCKTCKHWYRQINSEGVCERVDWMYGNLEGDDLASISVNKYADMCGVRICFRTHESFSCSLHEFV